MKILSSFDRIKRLEDQVAALKVEIEVNREKHKSDMDYIAMMTGINLEQQEDKQDETNTQKSEV